MTPRTPPTGGRHGWLVDRAADALAVARRVVRRPAARTILVACGVLLLGGVTTALARLHHAERHARAAREARLGHEEQDRGYQRRAVVHFREAVALEPTQLDYRLSLGRALVASGQLVEAASYLQDVLRDAPVNGAANLLLARIQRAQGEPAAEASYYRAIYGIWPPDEQRTRVETRLELIALLRQTANRDRVRAELSQLASAFPGDVPLQLRVARDLLELNYPDDAARLFRVVATRYTDSGPALAGIVEAEIARGDYAAAVAAALQALRRNPDDRQTIERRDLAVAALSLDPTPPRLSFRERTRRTALLARLARERLASCPRTGSAASPELGRLVEAWLAETGTLRRGDPDLGFALVEALARQVVTGCPPSTPPRALDLVLRKLASGGH
jgi:tetratricopeptide (TPR) repeat protein